MGHLLLTDLQDTAKDRAEEELKSPHTLEMGSPGFLKQYQFPPGDTKSRNSPRNMDPVYRYVACCLEHNFSQLSNLQYEVYDMALSRQFRVSISFTIL